jgi:diguanylate cyclase (GGDEF)-like protein
MINFDNNFLRNKVLALIMESEKLNERMAREIERISASQTGFYSQALEIFTRVRHSEDVAARHWLAIIEHYDVLAASLGRPVDLRTTVLDYFTNVTALKDEGARVSMQVTKGAERLPLIDDTTGAFNRRYLMITMKKEIKRATRYGKQFSLVLFAPDRTPPASGPLAMLQIVKQFVVELSAAIRTEDTLCRYDEHRFCVVLPETTAAGASQFAQRMQATCKHMPFFKEKGLTYGIGVAEFPASGKTPDALLGFLEKSLATAQESGHSSVGQLLRDRRRHRRFIMTWKVQCQDKMTLEPEVHECFSRDVSLGGVCVELDRELEPGRRLALTLHSALTRKVALTVDGVVRWKERLVPHRYIHGIEFKKLLPIEASLLERMLPLQRVRV